MYPTIIQDNLFQNPYEIIEISKKLKFYPPNKKENFGGTRTKSLHKTHKELYLKIVSSVVGNYYFNKKVNFTDTTVHFSKIKKKDRGRTWYHYDDTTCDYQCMAIEYIYWAQVSNMGILNDTATCDGIANEWEPCSKDLLESMDVLIYALITDSQYHLPQNAPDGEYDPQV